ncbi:TPA: hypothetical protein MYM09_003582 [Klebsiella pneumoniae]|uniref:Uncharacterized protein n=1 Tax=Klebsiella pneumoniae TaxID=573 RepID=A0A378C842_KLEPN|nr:MULTISPECIES: hypothetical protein [Klebsiella]HBQ5768340.1 hypothetical protein [Klebsiella pneumoniae subsp. pneumoniae]HBS5603090.1 hypothetical protein [Klebsiella quasipneumoniae subsp. quasipneumoniae]MCD5759095.1 hypothetical protein [Klebsiella pneumoniae]MCL1441410.1 hypothetical protein [Klebsiella quasipneumoniae]MEE2428060.1 hypothetical protein [Klebsiella pneumoniae]
MSKPDWEAIETAYQAGAIAYRAIADIEVCQRDVAVQCQMARDRYHQHG